MNNNDEKEGYEDDQYDWLDDGEDMSPAPVIYGLGALIILAIFIFIFA